SLRGVSPFTLGILRNNSPAAGVAESTISVLGANIPVGTVNILIPAFFNQYTFNVNVDQVVGANDQLRYRFNYDRIRQPNVDNADVKFNGSVAIDNRLASFAYIRTFSPRVVNEFRVAYRRQNQGFTVPGEFADFPNIVFDELGLAIGPEGNSPQGGITNFYQFVDNFSFTIGK